VHAERISALLSLSMPSRPGSRAGRWDARSMSGSESSRLQAGEAGLAGGGEHVKVRRQGELSSEHVSSQLWQSSNSQALGAVAAMRFADLYTPGVRASLLAGQLNRSVKPACLPGSLAA